VAAVNSASSKGVQVPDAEDTGSAKSTVPIRIAARKLSGIKCIDESLNFFIIVKDHRAAKRGL
jgi:hypothetical protein